MPQNRNPENKQIQTSKPPPHWPHDIRFINSAVYHVSVTPTARKYIEGNSRSLGDRKRIDNIKVVIRPIVDTSHPATGQYGLFAGQKIPKNSHIIDYLGEVHCDDRPDSDYDLSLCRLEGGVGVGIDACTMGNQARFVNDYRGITDKPNAMFIDGRSDSGVLYMSIWSGSQEIKKGQEILVSYGKSWWRNRRFAVAEEKSSTLSW